MVSNNDDNDNGKDVHNNKSSRNTNRDDLDKFFEACELGQIERVQKMLLSSSHRQKNDGDNDESDDNASFLGAMINQRNPKCSNDTPLIVAAENRHYNVVKLLIENDADIHVMNDQKETPLYFAAQHGNVEIAKQLLEKKQKKIKCGANDVVGGIASAEVNSMLHQCNDPQKESPLYAAVKHGELQMVQLLLEYDATDKNNSSSSSNNSSGKNSCSIKSSIVNLQDHQGSTPLIFATIQRNIPIMKLLLDHGADIGLADDFGMTAMDVAFQSENLQVIQVLLRDEDSSNNDSTCSSGFSCKSNGMGDTTNKSDVNRCSTPTIKNGNNDGGNDNGDDDNHHPNNKTSRTKSIPRVGNWTKYLDRAVKNQNRPLVEMILNYGAQVNGVDECVLTPLAWAASTGNLSIVNLLLTHGALPNKSDMVGNTPLLLATKRGFSDIMNSLLVHGADVDGKSVTPLVAAVDRGSHFCVNILLNHGVNLNKADRMGHTPLTCAIQHGWQDIIKVLLFNGADVNKPNERNVTPLQCAISGGELEVIQILLQHEDIKVSKGNKNYETALHQAVSDERLDIVKVLMEHGANPNIFSRQGQAPWMIALNNGSDEILEILEGDNINVNFIGSSGETVLHMHCLQSFSRHQELSLDTVQMLLERGADPNIINQESKTALHLAIQQNRPEIVQLLLRYGADMTISDETGDSCFLIAARAGHADIVHVLMMNGAYLYLQQNFESAAARTAREQRQNEAEGNGKGQMISASSDHSCLITGASHHDHHRSGDDANDDDIENKNVSLKKVPCDSLRLINCKRTGQAQSAKRRKSFEDPFGTLPKLSPYE